MSNQQPENEELRPWYKEPWTWFLIIVPITSVTASFSMIQTFNQTNVEMVVDDYYKKGKAINQELSRIKKAKSYGISAFLTVNNGQLLLDLNKNKQAPEMAALVISFYHATQGKRDFNLMATQRANGTYFAQLPEALTGNWQITVEPHDKQWKIQQRITLPAEDKLILLPR